MAQTPLIKGYEAGDVFIRDDLSRDYSSISAAVQNATNAPQIFLAGTPMVVTNPTLPTATAVAATETQNALTTGFVINGYLIDNTTILANSTMKLPIYTKFAGLVVDENAMPLVPPIVGGPAYLLASHIVQMNNLGIVHRAETTRQETQIK